MEIFLEVAQYVPGVFYRLYIFWILSLICSHFLLTNWTIVIDFVYIWIVACLISCKVIMIVIDFIRVWVNASLMRHLIFVISEVLCCLWIFELFFIFVNFFRQFLHLFFCLLPSDFSSLSEPLHLLVFKFTCLTTSDLFWSIVLEYWQKCLWSLSVSIVGNVSIYSIILTFWSSFSLYYRKEEVSNLIGRHYNRLQMCLVRYWLR